MANESKKRKTKIPSFTELKRVFGRYYRSFTLPQKVKEDKIEAHFKDGQLTITVPKAEETKPKELEIKIK